MRHILCALFCLAGVASAAPLELGSRRELFVDHFLIEKLDGLSLRMHEPANDGIALKLDQPWEGLFCAYPSLFKDGDRYRLYYRAKPDASSGDGSTNETVACAESTDGITWTRPSLNLFTIQGFATNNVVFTNTPYAHNFFPFLDERPGVPAAEKYKALAGYFKTGLHAFQSPDGYRWTAMQTNPVLAKGDFDSHNVAFWSVTEQQYVCYFRVYKTIDGHGVRWISRTTSKDFRNWTKAVEMNFGDAPPEQLYTSGLHPYYRAPHLYIGLAKRFFPGKVALPTDQAATLVADPHYRVASSDSVFMSTRGTDRIDRTFLEAFIRPGPTPQDWIARDNAPAWGVIAADNPREMFLYRLSHYAQPSIHLTRYRLRADGFSSVHASYRGGELLTKPFTFTGRQLALNFATSAAGGVQVEIQDENGAAFPGFALADCPEMIGDDIQRVISWKGKTGTDVSSLASKTVRLRFTLKDADLYALQFTP